MTNEEIKDDIIAACEKAKSAGYQIVAGLFGGTQERCACALSAVALANASLDDIRYDDGTFRRVAVRRVANERYGWTFTDTHDFIGGFDDCSPDPSPSDSDATRIGRAVRAAVLG